jgi:erythronate-4-phosphate dehydrogenase
MDILADENVPFAGDLFGALGSVTLAPGRDITERFPDIGRFDVLVIRSVTRVTGALLAAARRCRLIGSATIGTDHIDTRAVAQAARARGHPLRVISAPGSNADSVADYVWLALAHVTGREGTPLSGRSLGIVGCGNCGSRVARRAEGFGMEVVCCDPPRALREPSFKSAPLAQALRADFVTLHVPLTDLSQSGHPTRHMIGERQLAQMRSTAYLVNSSRGAVVRSSALVSALERRSIAGAVLDVFEGEPEPVARLVELAAITTPHVAGYAAEARRRGAIVVYRETCRTLGVRPAGTDHLLTAGLEAPEGCLVQFGADDDLCRSADAAVRALLGAVHDIGLVSQELKGSLASPDRGALFDQLRKQYGQTHARRELAGYGVALSGALRRDLREAIARRLKGFGVEIRRRGANYVLAPAGSSPP